MRTDQLIDQLSAELRPVRRRNAVLDAGSLAALCVLELGLFLAFGMMRPDMAGAIALPSFWWKLTSTGVIGLLSGAVAIRSLDPVRSARRGLAPIATLVALSLASGWLVDASHGGVFGLVNRLDWRNGLHCLVKIVVLSIPAIIGLAVLMRRGAPTDPIRTSLAAGLAAAAWGAFVFAFACPFDDVLYVALWYSLACAFVTLCARVILPRITHW
jgi:hypothetical protein